MQKPSTETLKIITRSVLENKIKDAWILPVTINYEKVLEGQTFPYELMGEDKQKESLMKFVKGLITGTQNLGKVSVKVSEPFSVKQYYLNNTGTPEQLLLNLGN